MKSDDDVDPMQPDELPVLSHMKYLKKKQRIMHCRFDSKVKNDRKEYSFCFKDCRHTISVKGIMPSIYCL